MSGYTDTRFLSAGAGLAVLGCVVAIVIPVVASQSAAFRGSLAASGLVGLVFAVQNVRAFRAADRPALAPATVTTVFGGWFIVAPLLYDPGVIATAGTQLAGLLTASFGGYMAVTALAE